MENPIEMPSGSSGNNFRKFAVLACFVIVIFMIAISGRAYLAASQAGGLQKLAESEERSDEQQSLQSDAATKEIASPTPVVTPSIPPNTEEQGHSVGALWRGLWPSPSPVRMPSPLPKGAEVQWDGTPEGCRETGGTYHTQEKSCHRTN